MDTRLGGFLVEIDDNEVALILLDPAPGENILAALVVGPAAPLTEVPFTVAKDVTIDLFQQASIEGREVMIDRLCRATAQKDRQPHLHSFELPFVEQPCPGECEDRHRCSAPFSGRKRGGGSGLVMVLDEADQPLLVRQDQPEMQPHVLGVVMLQPVVESLVVAVIEPLLLQFPFQVPVGLGDEQKIGVLRS